MPKTCVANEDGIDVSVENNEVIETGQNNNGKISGDTRNTTVTWSDVVKRGIAKTNNDQAGGSRPPAANSNQQDLSHS